MLKTLYKPIHSFVGDKTKPTGLEEYHGEFYCRIPFAELVDTTTMPDKIEYSHHYQKWSQDVLGRWAAEDKYTSGLSLEDSIKRAAR